MGHLVGGDRGGEKPEQYIYERGKIVADYFDNLQHKI